MNKPLSKNIIERKEFNYKKNNTSLNFNLRVDNSSELKDFKLCLEEALKDVGLILKTIKN